MIEANILNRLTARLAATLAQPPVAPRPFVVDGVLVGAITNERAPRLLAFTDVFVTAGDALTFASSLRDFSSRTKAMHDAASALAGEGALTAWRNERYAVADGVGPPLFLIERAAARYFGIATQAVHVNGLTALGDGSEGMWLARRSATKAIDPGMLDNLIGGGIAYGADVATTLRKEAWEEAGLTAAVASRAVAAGTVRIYRQQPDGIQRETVFVHDLVLPVDVLPINQDGEVVAFRLVRPEEVARLAGNTTGADVVTADASLVIADWLLRRGYVPAGSGAAHRIATLRRG